MITICILFLLYSVMGQPVGALVEKLKGVDWQSRIDEAKGWISTYASRVGRTATRPLLLWWLVMNDDSCGRPAKPKVEKQTY